MLKKKWEYSRAAHLLFTDCKKPVIVRFEVFMAVRMMFWVSVPCRFVGRCQRFGEIYCLHLQG
jgi:hypothetical protein